MHTIKQDRTDLLHAINHAAGREVNKPISLDLIQTELTTERFKAAISSLKARGYISTIEASGGIILFVKLTHDGIVAAEDGEPIPQPTVTITGGNNNIQAGNNNTQNITIGVTEDQVQRLVVALHEDGETKLAEAIEAEVVRPEEPHKLRKFFSRLVEATAKAGVAAATTAEVTQLLQ